jgi:aryl-alcohol dehydrogenase-like predicted oxidoreductase
MSHRNDNGTEQELKQEQMASAAEEPEATWTPVRGVDPPASEPGEQLEDGVSRRTLILSGLAGTLASVLPWQEVFAKDAPHEIPRRSLGNTGEKVSIIGIGGYHLGIPDEVTAIRIVRTALDSGVNFLDNCWDYNGGVSEERMGKALRDGYRAKAFVMSKIDGRDRKTATKQIDESLKRLQVDHLDLMQIHEVIRLSDPAACFSENGNLQALLDAKKAGKIRFIGFTGHKSPEMHLAMLNTARKAGFHFDTVQMPLNVMDAHYDSFEKLVLPVLVKEKIGVLGMKSLGNGIILKSGVISAKDCLRYALSLPTSVVITGCDSIEILEQALQVARDFKRLTDDERLALLNKTEQFARNGKFEHYKTTTRFDGTTHHPEWLG